jgi:hypothetical protein
MTGSHGPARDSRLASIDQQSASGDESPGGSRLLAVGSLGAVLLSVLGSLVAAAMLPDRVRIHWTLGLGSYYGPEFAPTVLVLAVFPVVVGATALGAYWGAGRLSHSDEFATLRPFYVVTVLGTLTALLATQAVLIAANL